MNAPKSERIIPALDNSQRTCCEVWTRVMGYHRPVSSFNTGEQGEFNERCFLAASPAVAV